MPQCGTYIPHVYHRHILICSVLPIILFLKTPNIRFRFSKRTLSCFSQRCFLLYPEILFVSDKVVSVHRFIQKAQLLPMCIIIHTESCQPFIKLPTKILLQFFRELDLASIILTLLACLSRIFDKYIVQNWP